MREAHAAIEAVGARVIAVGTGSAAQARHLMDTGTPFPCLVDAEGRLYRILGLGRVALRTFVDPATFLNYWRAWRRGARQGAITGDPRQLSGVAIFDAAGGLRWRHASRTIGDYPVITKVVAKLQRLRTQSL